MKTFYLGITLAGLVASTLIGCSRLILIGDPESIKQAGIALNGAITNGKASPNRPTSYWANFNLESKEETRRAYAPTFLDKVFGVSAPSSKNTQPNT